MFPNQSPGEFFKIWKNDKLHFLSKKGIWLKNRLRFIKALLLKYWILKMLNFSNIYHILPTIEYWKIITWFQLGSNHNFIGNASYKSNSWNVEQHKSDSLVPRTKMHDIDKLFTQSKRKSIKITWKKKLENRVWGVWTRFLEQKPIKLTFGECMSLWYLHISVSHSVSISSRTHGVSVTRGCFLDNVKRCCPWCEQKVQDVPWDTFCVFSYHQNLYNTHILLF